MDEEEDIGEETRFDLQEEKPPSNTVTWQDL